MWRLEMIEDEVQCYCFSFSYHLKISRMWDAQKSDYQLLNVNRFKSKNDFYLISATLCAGDNLFGSRGYRYGSI